MFVERRLGRTGSCSVGDTHKLWKGRSLVSFQQFAHVASPMAVAGSDLELHGKCHIQVEEREVRSTLK
jgi:hypothetical protein